MFFKEYHDAYDYACKQARKLKCTMAIKATKEFTTHGFRVSIWCKNDSWNCQFVTPDSPIIKRED